MLLKTFLLPLKLARHPDADLYVARAAADARAWGLLHSDADAARHAAFVQLSPLVYPYATFERLVAAGSFDQWLFFLDDSYDEDPAIGHDAERVERIMRRYLAALETGIVTDPSDGFEQMSAVVHQRLLAFGGPVFFRRLLANVRDYLFKGSLRALAHWQKNHVLAPHEYEVERGYDSGMYAVLEATQIACDAALPDDVDASPWLAELRRLCTNHAAFMNDLCSFQKEVVQKGYPFNRVRVQMHADGSTVLAASQKVIDEINAALLQFERCAAQIPRFDSPLDAALQRYLDGMRYWMSGNFAFSLCCGRYTHADSAVAELRTRWNLPELFERAPKALLEDRPRPSQPRPPRSSAPDFRTSP